MKILIEYWHIIAAVLGFSGGGGLIGFFAGKKKRQTDAVISTQNIYDTLTKQMEVGINEMREKIKELKNENVEQKKDFQKDITNLKQENVEQRKEMRALQSDNRNLHLEVTNMHKENNELKAMIRKLEYENKKLYSELQKYRRK